MSLWLAMVFAAAPVSLETLANDASLIVFARSVETRSKPHPSSTLLIEFVLKGEAANSETLVEETFIGQRGLFFLKAVGGSRPFKLVAPKSWLTLSLEQPDAFRVFPERLELPKSLLSKSTAHGHGGRSIAASEVFAALGFKPRSFAQPPSYRVINATCPRCTLDASLAFRIPSGAQDCGRLGESPGAVECVKTALKGSRAFFVRQEWSGIDSGGSEVFVSKKGSVQRIAFDDDVTGGTRPQCSSAVFATRCSGLAWSDDKLSCTKEEGSAHLCNEWEARVETLGEPIPLEELRCGETNVCPKPLLPSSHLCRTHRDDSLWCSPE